MPTATINGIPVEFTPGMSIIEAARLASVRIPSLCKHTDLDATAACGICVVRNRATGRVLRACSTPIEPGMDIVTDEADLVKVRRSVLELIMSKHPNECTTCGRNQNCELQTLCADFNIDASRLPSLVPPLPKDASNGSIVLDPRKCVLCGRCIQVCQERQNVWALSFLGRGISTRIAPAGDISMAESPCVSCGQCAAHCPTGAIVEYDESKQVWAKLADPNTVCVAQIAPAVRVAIGEAFGFPIGSNLTGKLYAALRRMGFKAVFDTNFGADVTIMEEGSEFVSRFVNGTGVLPLITSCCPAWVDFMEKYHHDMIPHFSTCKSPHEMVGALTKTYWAEREKVDPKRIFMVSIMPCTAKKWEVHRSADMASSGQQDVDVSLTTRELARMIKQSGIDFVSIPETQPDHLLGAYSGAGTIFGTTGGVMEAAIRTAAFLVTGQNLPNPDYKPVRGLAGVKTATLELAGHSIRIAVAHGLGHVETVINDIRKAKAEGREPPYHFVEVMACPGGCVGGGGQPYGVTDDLRRQRAAGLYREDGATLWRNSHDNPYVQKLYADYLGAPLSERAHHLLHTHYEKRPTYRR
jgi:NADH-quinone oxidoreductase subunit G